MDNKEKSKKLICSICGQEILKNPNVSGKPYAVRKAAPIICDMCSHDLANLDDENQEKLEAKNYHRLLKKPLAACDKETKTAHEAAKTKGEITLPELIDHIKSVIKGQDDAVKTITTAIYKNQHTESLEVKSNLIVLGESGSGKTRILQMLSEHFNVPYFIEDATRYTEAGYVGASIDDMLINLYKAAGNNIRKAEKGLLIIDEGDKKGASEGDIGRDVSGENVLFSMLSMIGGTKIPLTDNYGDPIGIFDTSRLTIVFIGAFPMLVKIREKRLKKTGVIGFANDGVNNTNLNPNYIASDFINGGFPKEFVARFNNIIELNKLTKEDLIDIIKNSESSTFLSYIKELDKKGVKLIYSEDVVSEIAEEASKLDVGARGVINVVERMFNDIMYSILCNPNVYTQCVINKEIVSDPSKFVLT